MIESSIAIGPLPLLLLPNFSFDYGYALYQLDHKEEWDVIPLNDSDEVQKFLENSNKSIDEIDIDDLAFEQ